MCRYLSTVTAVGVWIDSKNRSVALSSNSSSSADKRSRNADTAVGMPTHYILKNSDTATEIPVKR